jgi:hypothetical protein
MSEYRNKHGFTLPESFLSQLAEYTQGYILLVCNERGELFAHESYDTPVIKLGLTNFGNMHMNAAQQHMHNMALDAEEGYDTDFPDEPEAGN